jgi:hypothetical protein
MAKMRAQNLGTIPHDAHNDLLCYITNLRPIFNLDELYRRVISLTFINYCSNCNSNLIRSVLTG